LAILRSERIQDGVNRIEFVAGRTALERLREKRTLLSRASEALRVDEDKLPSTVERFFKEWKERGKAIENLETRLSEVVAADLESGIGKKGDLEVLIEVVQNVGPEILQKVGQLLAGKDRVIVLLGVNDPRTSVLVVLGETATGKGLHAGRMAKEIAGTLGGGGGGSVTTGRGAGKAGRTSEAMDRAASLIEGI
jgi:alanyl-tRNA synthetase